MIIPKLNFSKRSREYNECKETTRDRIVYGYLFEGKSHRNLDDEYTQLDSKYTRGYISMGVLHYLGMRNEFKGIFKEFKIEDAISELKKNDEVNYKNIIESLQRYSIYTKTQKVDEGSRNNKDDYNLRSVNVDTIAKFDPDDEQNDDNNSSYDLSLGIKKRKKRTERHNIIVKKFANLLEKNDFSLYEGRIDCLGIKNKNLAIIGEIKTLDGSDKDEYNQVIKSFAQLYYYQEFNMGQFKNIQSKRIAIFESKISDKHIEFFKKNNIIVLWLNENDFCSTDSYIKELEGIISISNN